MDLEQKAALFGWKKNPGDPNYYYKQITAQQLEIELMNLDDPLAFKPTYETAEIILDINRVEREFGTYLLIHMHRLVHRYENWWNRDKYPVAVHHAAKNERHHKLDRMMRRYLAIDKEQ